MEKKDMYFDVNKARIYQKYYRPSTNLWMFVKTLFGIMLIGDSPISKDYRVYKRTK